MINLNGIVFALLRYWWLLVTASGMAGLITYHIARQTPPTYVASTTLMVGDILRSPKPGDGEFNVAQNLANGYAQLAQRQPILEGATKALGSPMSWDALRQRTVVVHPNGALTIEVRVMDTDPARARDLAAAIAEQMVAASPTLTRRQELDQRRQFVQGELNSLQAKIQQGRDDLAKKQAALSQETTARGVLDRQDEIKALDLNLTTWRASYNDLLASLSGDVDPNSLTIIEPSALPSSPAGPRGFWFAALAATAGFAVAALGIVTVEIFDDRLRSRDDVQANLGEGLQGLVTYVPAIRHGGRGPLAVLSAPNSLAADTYRLLAAQLRFGVLGGGSHTLLVTSPMNGEGKSTTAANLAAALALGGAEVIAIDLDLRKPSLHALFDIQNRDGASAMLREDEYSIDDYAVTTMLPRLRVVPAGTVIGNPTELLSRSVLPLLQAAKRSADFIIVDGPPMLAVADAAVLAAFVPDTVLVARCARTTSRNLREAADVLRGLPTEIRALVVNAMPQKDISLYGYNTVEPQSPSIKQPNYPGKVAGRIYASLPGGTKTEVSDRNSDEF